MRYFFPLLIVRQKRDIDHRNLEIGDIVLIQGTNVVRGHWKTGKISSELLSTDEKVRNVDVAYKHTNTKE